MGSLYQVERLAQALRNHLARRLADQVAAIELVEAKPEIATAEVATFTGLTSKTLELSVDGAATVTTTFTGTSAATAASDISSAVTAITATADVLTDSQGTRLLLTHKTAASGSTTRSIKVVGGSGLSILGLEAGEESVEEAVPTIRKSNLYTYNPMDAGQVPGMPCVWVDERSSTERRLGSERIHDMTFVLGVWAAHSRPEVAARHVDRIVRGIVECVQNSRSIDGIALGLRFSESDRLPVAGQHAAGLVSSASVTLTGAYCE